MQIVYGANIKDHINVIFQNLKFLILGDLVQLNLNKTVPVALVRFCTEVQAYPKGNVCLSGRFTLVSWNEVNFNLKLYFRQYPAIHTSYS